MQHLSTGLVAISEDTFNGESVLTVNARDLHTFLGVSTRFNDWIQRRIAEYDLVEGLDFTITQKRVIDSSGVPQRQEYFITLDVAKELSMVERTEKGREIRRYFIEAEKQMRVLSIQASQSKPIQLPAPNYATFDAIARKNKISKSFLNCILARADVGTIYGPYPDMEYYTAHTRDMIPYQRNNILWNVEMVTRLIDAEKAPERVQIPRLERLEEFQGIEDRVTTADLIKVLDTTRSHLVYYFGKLRLCTGKSLKRTPLGDSMYEVGAGWIRSKLLNHMTANQPKQLTII